MSNAIVASPLRWLKELFKPELKCGRCGHILKKQTRQGIRKTHPSESDRGIVMFFKEERDKCTRCKNHGYAEEVICYGLKDWPAPRHIFEQFHKDGYVIQKDWT